MDLVTQLLHHVDMASGAYKIGLVEKIIEICASEKYALVTDFAWYIDILVILARTKGIDGHGKHSRNLGPLVSNQIIEVTLRVLPVTRPYTIRRMIGLILDGGTCNDKGHFLGTFGLESNVSMMPEVLPVAAFIIGEYSSLIDEAISLEIIDGEEEDDELLKL
jgi:AP-3 complex subunit delta-1